jgi:hypothetical protein
VIISVTISISESIPGGDDVNIGVERARAGEGGGQSGTRVSGLGFRVLNAL